MWVLFLFMELIRNDIKIPLLSNEVAVFIYMVSYLLGVSTGILILTPAGMLSGSGNTSTLCFTMYGQYFLVPKNLTEARMIVSPFCKVYSS